MKGKLQRQRDVNRAMRRLRYSNRCGSHVNCFRYHRNNSEAHERTKFEVYKELVDQGHKVITEAIFENGKRCDIVCLSSDPPRIIEILHTETEEEAAEKVKDYPAGFTVEFIKAKEY